MSQSVKPPSVVVVVGWMKMERRIHDFVRCWVLMVEVVLERKSINGEMWKTDAYVWVVRDTCKKERWTWRDLLVFLLHRELKWDRQTFDRRRFSTREREAIQSSTIRKWPLSLMRTYKCLTDGVFLCRRNVSIVNQGVIYKDNRIMSFRREDHLCFRPLWTCSRRIWPQQISELVYRNCQEREKEKNGAAVSVRKINQDNHGLSSSSLS